MDKTSFKRILKFGWKNMGRNKEATLASIFVIFLAVSLVSVLFLSQGITDHLVNEVKEKIGISAYFKSETSENEINNVKNKIKESFPEAKIIYISAADALEKFKESHEGEPIYEKALDQVGGNPFRGSLDISSEEEESYEEMVAVLEANFSNYIYKVDYLNRKEIIDQVFNISRNINIIGISLSILLIGLAVLISFNTIRMVIFSQKEEINTMHLVGSPKIFMNGPFIVQGVLYGIFSLVVTNMILIPFIYYISPILQANLAGFDLWVYLGQQLIWYLGLQLLVGVGLGVAATWLAVRHYLRN